jgi:hypothetical protein
MVVYVIFILLSFSLLEGRAEQKLSSKPAAALSFCPDLANSAINFLDKDTVQYLDSLSAKCS